MNYIQKDAIFDFFVITRVLCIEYLKIYQSEKLEKRVLLTFLKVEAFFLEDLKVEAFLVADRNVEAFLLADRKVETFFLAGRKVEAFFLADRKVEAFLPPGRKVEAFLITDRKVEALSLIAKLWQDLRAINCQYPQRNLSISNRNQIIFTMCSS